MRTIDKNQFLFPCCAAIYPIVNMSVQYQVVMVDNKIWLQQGHLVGNKEIDTTLVSSNLEDQPYHTASH